MQIWKILVNFSYFSICDRLTTLTNKNNANSKFLFCFFSWVLSAASCVGFVFLSVHNRRIGELEKQLFVMTNFKKDDKVFATLYRFPWWPAVVQSVHEKKKKTIYQVDIFGMKRTWAKNYTNPAFPIILFPTLLFSGKLLNGQQEERISKRTVRNWKQQR